MQYLGQFAGVNGIVGEQAFNADGHVFQATGGIEARRDGEADVSGGQPGSFTPGNLDQGAQAGAALPRAQPTQARCHQGAIVEIQRHQIGHGAHCNKIQQGGKVRSAIRERTGLTQLSAQCEQHVEHHAHARQHLAGECITLAVRIDDGIGRRQAFAGQMVVGDQHLPAQ